MSFTKNPGITMHKCAIRTKDRLLITNLSWEMNANETWLITGSNGGGKNILGAAITGQLQIEPEAEGFYSNIFSETACLVSFETAAALIEEEKTRDESDFVEGGIDPGRTVRTFLFEHTPEATSEDTETFLREYNLLPVLDRGLKYLSTGEMRKCLLCRALILKPSLLVIDEPFEGLDTNSRKSMQKLLSRLIREYNRNKMKLVLLMDRYENVPAEIDHVLELACLAPIFSGTKQEYELFRLNRDCSSREFEKQLKTSIQESFNEVRTEGLYADYKTTVTRQDPLVMMKNVSVAWGEKKILENLSWTVMPGEHWLIQGPNGSGKTTLLELITGDNPQVFRNDISLFGSRRGSGETIWELKAKMGIVSYRLHVDYRSVGDISVENVVLSGLHDSVGLYEYCGEEEKLLAKKWLNMAGFSERDQESFNRLSYGEQRAVLIIRATIKCPRLLILDEPCHGLDSEHRLRILDLLEAIAGEGTSTLLHVTHDPAEVLPCEKYILELRPDEIPMYAIRPNF